MDRPPLFKDINLNNAREETESFEEYKERRANNNKLLKAYFKRGFLAWFSSGQGTYIRKVDGEL